MSIMETKFIISLILLAAITFMVFNKNIIEQIPPNSKKINTAGSR